MFLSQTVLAGCGYKPQPAAELALNKDPCPRALNCQSRGGARGRVKGHNQLRNCAGTKPGARALNCRSRGGVYWNTHLNWIA